MTPRLIIAADLHADLSPGTPILDLLPEVPERGDLLIIAGDLCNALRKRCGRFLPDLVGAAGPGNVLVVPGNHDYYGDALDNEAQIAAEVRAHGAVFAQRHEEIRGCLRVLCCTLWTDLLLTGPNTRVTGQVIRGVMNDYRFVRMARGGYRKAGPLDTLLEHRKHRAWLEERLAEPFAGRTVVVTHHAPLPEAAPPPSGAAMPGRPEPDVRAAYASDLREMIERTRPDEWAFGHTHAQFSAEVGGTLVRNVSVGYPHEAAAIRQARHLLNPDAPPFS